MSTSPAAAARATVPPGTRLGRYEILATIAQGGMATVYLGRSLGAAGFQRLVAIKCLHPHIVADTDFVEMFMDEARLAARIRHPNVVPTLDLENGADGLFLVMEYIEGDSLLGLLRAASKTAEPIPPMIAIRVVLDSLHGLQAAHELTGDRGEPLRIVHRDVSPHNILVGTDGISRITDFGIARADSRISHTREGQIKGKLSYMSPEQTSGEHVDRRSDIFSTGIVLWEALAARRLFKGDSDAEVLRNLLQAPVPKLAELASFPPALDGILHRALARNIEERYATAAEFAEALEAAGATIGVASTRAVADYVRKLAGGKVAQIQEQVRALAGSLPQPIPRPVPSPSPDNTQEHEAATVLVSDTDTAVRIARGSLVIPSNAPHASLVPSDARAALPVIEVPMQPARRHSNTVVILGALAGLLTVVMLVGLVFLLLALRTSDETNAPKPTVKSTALPVPPDTQSAPPAVDVSSLPTAQATSSPQIRPPIHVHGPAPHPTAKPTTTGGSGTATTAQPAGSVPFNPESM